MKLYGFSRSSAAFRVRIALNLKGIAWEHVNISLPDGDQFDDGYRKLNPQGRVPTLIDGDKILYQSMAILEYLEETQPKPAFLPSDPLGRARVRGLADIIACDIHPLNNLAILKFLGGEMGVDKDAVDVTWYQHWIYEGFNALEAHLEKDSDTGTFAHGETPGLVDICIVPQVFNAERYECDLSAYPRLISIFAECMKLDAFDSAQPSRQPN
ncbi:MAG: maleylacetoacetate isomerase [Rhodospirillaceae bacterium]|nr:maleylacetoacetate isomerase [Rhodospirillaceae bacterium]RPF97715.1 MAG: maleylacetoacetate isomerase [Rhodospirillaceae bacterium TMED63]RZO38220.1 MAG: maleylacetoacetate isomerase [Rhodospirillaceae bacterium]